MDELSDQQIDEINAALFAGQKIRAIYLYRTAVGRDLAHAKNSVEAIEARLRAEAPDQFTEHTIKVSGVWVWLILACIVAGVAFAVLNNRS